MKASEAIAEGNITKETAEALFAAIKRELENLNKDEYAGASMMVARADVVKTCAQAYQAIQEGRAALTAAHVRAAMSDALPRAR
jgi:hypothetical protein